MAKRHYDNKNDLLAEMKRRKDMADKAVSATYTMYMMLACLILYEDFEYDEENIQAFVDGFEKRFDLYEQGKLTVDDMACELLEKVGVVVELPKFEG